MTALLSGARCAVHTRGAAAMTSSRHSASSAEPLPSCPARHRPTAPMLTAPRWWRPASALHSRLMSTSHGPVSMPPAGWEMLDVGCMAEPQGAEVTDI